MLHRMAPFLFVGDKKIITAKTGSVNRMRSQESAVGHQVTITIDAKKRRSRRRCLIVRRQSLVEIEALPLVKRAAGDLLVRF